MGRYTADCEQRFKDIQPEDDDFLQQLLASAELFRPFSAAMDEFISGQGYGGELSDTDGKVRFIRRRFREAGITPPREVREWYASGQPVARKTVFLILFAFGLDEKGAEDFFRRIYARERSFYCRNREEAAYYFCIRRNLPYTEAKKMTDRLKEEEGSVKAGGAREYQAAAGSGPVLTAEVKETIDRLETPEELLSYLSENREVFDDSQVTAGMYVRRLWEEAAGRGGLLIRERQRLASNADDAGSFSAADTRRLPLSDDGGLKVWDACLALFRLDKESIGSLSGDRSLKPVLKLMHKDIADCFPDRQGIDRILRGEKVSYERMRKWLILLSFYTFWAEAALDTKSYQAGEGNEGRCISRVNQFLVGSGFPQLYAGNPYDWLFLYCACDREPLITFREIWQELAAEAAQEEESI